jgi:hypothetical protein
MTRTEIRSCLRTLQVVATIPELTEEQVRELLREELVVRTKSTGGAGAIQLTSRGILVKSGEI